MPYREPYPQNGIAPRDRVATLVRSTRLATAPISTRAGTVESPTYPIHVHDVDVTLPAGYVPDRLTWDQWHTSYGAVIRTNEPLFERCRFHQLGDGISLQGSNWIIRDCWFDDLYDDAVEADSLTPGLIEGCVFDGVHIGVSARNSAIKAAANSVVTIRRSAIRLRPQRESFLPWKYNDPRRIDSKTEPVGWRESWIPTQPQGQHGPFFKWSPTSPALVLDDVVLAAPQPSSYGGGLGPPRLVNGTVTLIGYESWPPEDVVAWEQSPVTVRYGTWNDWAAIASAPHPAKEIP